MVDRIISDEKGPRYHSGDYFLITGSIRFLLGIKEAEGDLAQSLCVSEEVAFHQRNDITDACSGECLGSHRSL